MPSDHAEMWTPEHRARWRTARVEAYIWWCQDEECDCTEPVIARITPNHSAGYPWIHREALWVGEFLSDTFSYTPEDRERLQYAPLREACERLGVEVPEEARR